MSMSGRAVSGDSESYSEPDFKYPYDGDGRESGSQPRCSARAARRLLRRYTRDVRCAFRYDSLPVQQGTYNGFRVVVSPLPEAGQGHL